MKFLLKFATPDFKILFSSRPFVSFSFGPYTGTPGTSTIELFQSNGEPRFIEIVAKNLAAIFGTDKMRAFAFYLRASGTFGRMDRTLIRDLAFSLFTSDNDGDDCVALDCFRYNVDVCAVFDTTPFKELLECKHFKYGEILILRAFKTSGNDFHTDSLWRINGCVLEERNPEPERKDSTANALVPLSLIWTTMIRVVQ